MQDDKRKHDNIKAILIALIVSALIIITTSEIYKSKVKDIENTSKLKAMNELTEVKDRLQGAVNLRLNYTDFFRIMIENHRGIEQEEFEQFAELIISQFNSIKTITIAPGYVIKYIYPLEGNESKLGIDLLYDNTLSESVIEENASVSLGPSVARGGDTVFVNRSPLYVRLEGKRLLWGLSVVSLDFNELLEEAYVKEKNENFYYALKTENTSGKNSSYYWGRKEIFDKDCITKTVVLPKGEWELAVYPVNGWLDNSEELLRLIILLGATTPLLAFIITYRAVIIILKRKRQATTDPLTGVMNKGEFREYFDKQILNSITKDSKGGILVIDIDDFKNINDNFGHQMGDFVLINITERIKNILRRQDVLARIGGDEFAILIQHMNTDEELAVIAKRILTEVSKKIEYGSITINVSVSIGGAIFPEHGKDLNELFRVADSNMYISKKSGKNKYVQK